MIPLYKRYVTKKPFHVYAFNAFFGVKIYEPENCDVCDCVAAWTDGENETGFRRHKIYYTANNRPYIRKGNLRIYLDE